MTSFAALRLLFMRSSSASVDLYVSSLISLLALLRLYAILKALAYYRRVRRLNDPAETAGTLLMRLQQQIGFLQPSEPSKADSHQWPTNLHPPASFNPHPDPHHAHRQNRLELDQSQDPFGFQKYPNRVTPAARTRSSGLVVLQPQENQQIVSAAQIHQPASPVLLVRSQPKRPTRRRHASSGASNSFDITASQSELFLVPAKSRQRASSSTAVAKIQLENQNECESEPSGASRRLSRVDRANIELGQRNTEIKTPEVLGRRETRQQHQMSLQDLFLTPGIEGFNSVRSKQVNQDSPTVYTLMRKKTSQTSSATVGAKYRLVAKYRHLSSLDSTATTTRATGDSSTSCGPEDSDTSDQLDPSKMMASGLKQSEEFVEDSIRASQAGVLLGQTHPMMTSESNPIGKCKSIDPL